MSDGDDASDKDSCGSLTSPCKFLQQGVSKCREGVKVIVTGGHNITSGVGITRSVTVIGRRGATIQV